jgi:Flp pilus assembly protein TadG
LASDVRGQELVEFAFILPALFMLLLGIFYFGRAISVYQAIGRAAREGDRVALATTCASCGDTSNYPAAVAAVNNALSAASLDPALARVTGPTMTVLNPSDPANYQVNQVSITVRYPVRFPIPFTGRLSRRRFNLTSTVSMRQEF